MKKEIEDILDSYTKCQINVLEMHLKKRYEDKVNQNQFNVVFDLLHECDLNCLGCGTNAILKENNELSTKMSTDDVKRILREIFLYTQDKHLIPFINFGGGEPFLREDIVEIIKYASKVLGMNHIGIDTNASLPNSYNLISEVIPYVSYVGISINGLKDYHNWWSNAKMFLPYDRAMKTLEQLCNHPDFSKKIEVTTVATKKNIHAITDLMKELRNFGVINYSVHRAIPVGRMCRFTEEIIPDYKDYLKLLIELVNTSNQLGMNAHMHHTIEAIYGAILFGINTYDEKSIMLNRRSSISIDPSGIVRIDPWCTTVFWRDLVTLGSLCDLQNTLNIIFSKNSSVLNHLHESFSIKERCGGCKVNCSGGSRIVAATTALLHSGKTNVSIDELLTAMKEKDPACPYYAYV